MSEFVVASANFFIVSTPWVDIETAELALKQHRFVDFWLVFCIRIVPEINWLHGATSRKGKRCCAHQQPKSILHDCMNSFNYPYHYRPIFPIPSSRSWIFRKRMSCYCGRLSIMLQVRETFRSNFEQFWTWFISVKQTQIMISTSFFCICQVALGWPQKNLLTYAWRQVIPS